MPADPSLTRRTTLAGAATGSSLLLGGCRLDPSAPGQTGTPTVDPDARIIRAARAELTALLRAGAHLDPSVSTRTRTDLTAAHRAQLVALGGHPPRRLRGTASRGGDLRRRESLGQRRLARWADEARSGALARLLASASASIAATLAADDEAADD